jgi:hypothetical protein
MRRLDPFLDATSIGGIILGAQEEFFSPIQVVTSCDVDGFH